MLQGSLYNANTPTLLHARQRAKELCWIYNTQISPCHRVAKAQLLEQLLGRLNEPEILTTAWIEAPFHVDYGSHLQVGSNFYANHGVTILDAARITIGKNCLLAPHVCISTATHPVNPLERAAGEEYAREITIGDNCWVGANATIGPGVVLGNNVVVGAGAVVTKSFPEGNVVLGGVPAKVLRKVEEEDLVSMATTASETISETPTSSASSVV